MATRGNEMDKSIVGERLKVLREGVHLSQAKLAAQFKNVDQPAIFRYERGYAFPPYHVLMQYADYFDVSLDYIFGRTDAPQGKLYQNRPKVTIDNAQLRDFLEMCFDPNSPANAKFKDAILGLFEKSTE